MSQTITSQKAPGDTQNERELLLSQWQTGVEMAHLTSQRRDQMNTLFITLNLGITSCLEWILGNASMLLIPAIVSCFIWYRYIQHFRILIKIKYELIHAMEESLPFQVYRDEYCLLKAQPKYRSGHTLEKVLPWLFSAIYFLMLCKSLL